MTTKTRMPADVLDAFWTYEDVLLLALAYLPDEIQWLTAEAGCWNTVVSDLKDRFRDRAPELLAEVRFTYRPPMNPYSEQLDDFFRDAGVSGILAAGPPRYNMYALPPRVKRLLLDEHESALKPYKDVIKEMSVYLEQLAAPAEPEL